MSAILLPFSYFHDCPETLHIRPKILTNLNQNTHHFDLVTRCSDFLWGRKCDTNKMVQVLVQIRIFWHLLARCLWIFNSHVTFDPTLENRRRFKISEPSSISIKISEPSSISIKISEPSSIFHQNL